MINYILKNYFGLGIFVTIIAASAILEKARERRKKLVKKY